MIIKTIDGHNIPGIFLEADNSKGIVILSHGITSEKNEGGLYSDLAEELKASGYSSYRFDYRGHGDSEINSRDMSVSGEVIDLYSVLKNFEGTDNIYLISASFAASITLVLFANYVPRNLKKVIFLNPVTSYNNTFINPNTPWAKSFFPNPEVDSILKSMPIKIGSKEFNIGPQLVIDLFNFKIDEMDWPDELPIKLYHGENDEIVSIHDSFGFIKRLNKEDISHKFYANAGHGLEEVKEELFTDMVDYLNEKRIYP